MYANQESPIAEINRDTLESIIDAILDGKYSYACLMTLEATGHDPLQYIPYRTYNRLQKQRQARYRAAACQKPASKVSSISSKISDIEHVEPLSQGDRRIAGGFGFGRFGGDNLLFWPC